MSKASNGWIQKRGTRYRARIIVDGIEWSESFDTKSLASDYLRQIRERHRLGRLRQGLDSTKITLGEALQRYAKEVSPAKKNARKEIGAVARLLREEPRLCAIPLGHVMTADLNDFALRRMSLPSVRTGEPVSAATVRGDLALISNLFTVSRARWGYESIQNPVVRGSRPPVGKARTRRVKDDEFRRLFAAGLEYERDFESSVPICAVIAFAGLTAMRRGEIAQLDWADVDLERGIVVLHETKNGSSRAVPLREEAYALLRALGPRKAGRVFDTTGAAIGTAWHRVRERAGIEDLHFHDLRHEATSRFFEDATKFGLTDTEIGSITGHKTWAMLQRYTHLRSVDIAAKLRPNTVRTAPQHFAIEYLPPLTVIERRDGEGRFRKSD